MPPEDFKLGSREDVEKFESLIWEYSEARSQLSLTHIPLVSAWDQLQCRTDGGRVFTALLDVYLNLHMVHLEFTSLGAVWNSEFSKGKLQGGSVLDSNAKFFGKMDIHRFASGFVIRYRAIWDKIMGLFLLLHCPEAYDKFLHSKSKKKSFQKAASHIKEIPQEFVSQLLSTLERFDNDFRTPEVHGTGKVRKWSLTMEELKDSPIVVLSSYWNVLNLTMFYIGRLFVTKTDRPIQLNT